MIRGGVASFAGHPQKHEGTTMTTQIENLIGVVENDVIQLESMRREAVDEIIVCAWSPMLQGELSYAQQMLDRLKSIDQEKNNDC
jgi:hypothetical protein